MPVQSSSQVKAFRMSVGMGRMLSTLGQAIAQETTTAQLLQILVRDGAIEH